MEIVKLSPEELVPYENNAKVHTEEQVSKLATLIQTQGWRGNPIIVDSDNVIIAGHGRRAAAMKIGLKEVPVYVAADMSDEQAMAMRLSDNRIAVGEYDENAIRDELLKLAEYDIDMTDLGFDVDEIDFGAPDDSDIDAMLAGIDDEDEDGEPVPTVERNTPKEESYESAIAIMINFESEEDQEKVYQEMIERGFKCSVMSI